jgi:hypothetical protein
VTSQAHTTLLADLADGHRAIRDVLDRLDAGTDDWPMLAEQLSEILARHRCSCTESVLALLGHTDREDHQQQVRLLLAATRGANQLADRLRLPARDPTLLTNVLIALRSLVREHERLELEIVRAVIEERDGANQPMWGTERFDLELTGATASSGSNGRGASSPATLGAGALDLA